MGYRAAWGEQERVCGRAGGVREETAWKLLGDVVGALEFLHETCGVVHRDVKADNVLVACPGGGGRAVVPALPVFKLCDFSRAVRFPARDGEVAPWAGTVEYAPPLAERLVDEPARPAGDMWSLGATVQEFALGFCPVQSRRAFVAQMDLWGEPHPELEGDEEVWAQEVWRDRFCAAYRPLNVSEIALRDWWDVDANTSISRSYVPFSDELNKWYTKLWTADWTHRVTSAALAKDLIPLIDGYLCGEKVDLKKCRTDSVLVAQTATPPATPPRTITHDQVGYRPQVKAGLHNPNRAPSYQGNDYPPLSSESMYVGPKKQD